MVKLIPDQVDEFTHLTINIILWVLGQEAGKTEVKLGIRAHCPGQLVDLFPAKEDVLSFCTEETSELDSGQFPVSTTHKLGWGWLDSSQADVGSEFQAYNCISPQIHSKSTTKCAVTYTRNLHKAY